MRAIGDLVALRGAPRTLREISSDLAIALGSDFPDLVVDDYISDTLTVTTERALSSDEETAIRRVHAQEGLLSKLVLRVNTDAVGAQGPFRSEFVHGDIALVPSRRSNIPAGAALRTALEADDDFWAEKRHAVLGSVQYKHARDVLPAAFLRGGLGCLVDASVFPPENIRNYLSLYNTVYLVAPLSDHMATACRALSATPRELADLLAMGRVRLLLPQAVDRYDQAWLSEVAERAPDGVLLSRRLAAATVIDTRRRCPLFYPVLGVPERRILLSTLTQFIDTLPSTEFRSWMGALRDTLIDAWCFGEEHVHDRGAMGTAWPSVPNLVANIYKALRGTDLSLEFWSAGAPVQWAAAMGANLFPAASASFSQATASEIVASFLSRTHHDRVPTVASSVHAVLDGVLALDGDVPLLPFARDFGSGDVERLRALVLKMAAENIDEDFLLEAIDKFNADVRAYERRPDRLRSLGILSLVAASLLSALPASSPVRQFAPFAAPLLTALVTLAGEEFGAKFSSVGMLLDFMNGALAGQRQEAVLVARVKKDLKVLKG